MKAKKMPDLVLILISVVGFVAWAFCQYPFLKSSVNASEDSRLIFPMIVPILSGILVCAVYVIWLRHSPHRFLWSSVQVKSNLVFLIIASVGLAIAYFFYALLAVKDPKNIAIIPILNTVFLLAIAFFVKYENNEFHRPERPKPFAVAGALVTLLGVVVMKYGDSFWKR